MLSEPTSGVGAVELALEFEDVFVAGAVAFSEPELSLEFDDGVVVLALEFEDGLAAGAVAFPDPVALARVELIDLFDVLAVEFAFASPLEVLSIYS